MAALGFNQGRLPPRLADLDGLPLLRRAGLPWSPWFAAAGIDLHEPAAGQEIALTRRLAATPDLAVGQLVRLFEMEIDDGRAWHLLSRPRDHADQTLMAVRIHLLEEARRELAPRDHRRLTHRRLTPPLTPLAGKRLRMRRISWSRHLGAARGCLRRPRDRRSASIPSHRKSWADGGRCRSPSLRPSPPQRDRSVQCAHRHLSTKSRLPWNSFSAFSEGWERIKRNVQQNSTLDGVLRLPVAADTYPADQPRPPH